MSQLMIGDEKVANKPIKFLFAILDIYTEYSPYEGEMCMCVHYSNCLGNMG